MRLRDTASRAGFLRSPLSMVFYFERVGSEEEPESLKFRPSLVSPHSTIEGGGGVAFALSELNTPVIR